MSGVTMKRLRAGWKRYVLNPKTNMLEPFGTKHVLVPSLEEQQKAWAEFCNREPFDLDKLQKTMDFSATCHHCNGTGYVMVSTGKYQGRAIICPICKGE